jgi:hypothetical protein
MPAKKKMVTKTKAKKTAKKVSRTASRAKFDREFAQWAYKAMMLSRLIDDKTIINHIGLVIRVSEKQIVTIEGNTSGAGDQRNGGEVMVKSRALGARSFVVGYGRPTYDSFSGDLPDRPKGEK